MMIRNNKKKVDNTDIKLEVKAGKIKQTEQYNYLGEVYNEKGSNMSKIEAKGQKVEGMISDIKRESSEWRLGKASMKVTNMLIKTIVTPTLLKQH